MKTRLTFQWGSQHLEVGIHTPADRRSRVIMGLEATVLLGWCTGLLIRRHLLPDWLLGTLLGMTGVLLCSLALRAAKRFTFREKIFVDSTHITLLRATCFRKSLHSYDLAGIGPLRFCFPEDEAVAAHSRPGDLFNDAHSGRLRRALAQGENLFFTYGGKRVYFGKGVYSWHAEELAFYLRLFCGTTLQFGPEWEMIAAAGTRE